MSWTIVLRSTGKTLGTKNEVRERFLSACEKISGNEVPRRGPTEVDIDPSFNYEILMSGQKWAIEEVFLDINVTSGDPHVDSHHPVWSFLKELGRLTGWKVSDTRTGSEI